MIQKQSNFSRTLYNEAKNGAYYTDVKHSERIGRLFSIPAGACVLEPDIGDGRAVEAFLDGAEKEEEDVRVFGVDIETKASKEARERRYVRYCLNADFLSEVRISSKVFSLCFCNPPYINTGEHQVKRMEQRFVEKIHGYIKQDGYLVLIVSFPTMGDYDFLMSLLSYYTCEGLWRFDDAEYEKYKQIVFIGRRKQNIGVFHTELERFKTRLNLNKLPYLPGLDATVNMKYEVPESRETDIDLFMETSFHPEANYEALQQSPLYNIIGNNYYVDTYSAINLGQPPLPLKKDLTYLCAVSGGGQGIVGTEEDQDMHLQRGSAKNIEESGYNENEESGKIVSETVRTRTQITLKIIQNNGEITILK